MMERICILMFKPLSIKWIRKSYSRDFKQNWTTWSLNFLRNSLHLFGTGFWLHHKVKKGPSVSKTADLQMEKSFNRTRCIFLRKLLMLANLFYLSYFSIESTSPGTKNPDPSLGTYLHNSRTKSSYKSRCENHFNVECKQSECPGNWQRYWNKHERFSSSMLDDQAGT